MHTHSVRRTRGLNPILAASFALLAFGCAPDVEGYEADGFQGMSDEGGSEGDSELDEKASSGQWSKLRNEGTGVCLRRSTSLQVGNGYEVYQASCNDTGDETLWRAECNTSSCKYVTGDSTKYCLKASSSLKASGGSYNVYAAPCADDKDQMWSVRDLGGGRLQLKSTDTGRCVYTSEGETTADGKPQVVQRDCGTSSKFQFTLVGSTGGDSTGGDGTGGDGTGGDSTGGGGSGVITHVGTTKVWDSNGQGVTVARPSGTQAGDLLVLFLHRTDDVLPLQVSGWKRVAECYKTGNEHQCVTASDCSTWYDSSFCRYFGSSARHGQDLAQAVFVKTASASEPSSYRFDLNRDSSGHPGWAILTTLRGASTTNPVRDWAHVGCDNRADSIFPSVYGQAGDMLLMSQSYDDAVAQSKFGAPSGASTFGYISNSDEAGFLFGRRLRSSGETGTMSTIGDGASGCKDALISLTIRPR